MRIYLMLALCVFFWSLNFILGRYIHDELAPIEFATFRWLGVFLVFLPFIIKKHHSITKVLKHNFIILTLLSFLSIAMFNTLLYVGLQYTTATNALLINSSVPILIIIFSAIILKTAVTRLQIVGVLFSMLGVIYLAIHGNIYSLITLSFGRGDIWIIASSLSWALYSVLIKFKPKDFDAYFATIVMLGVMMLLCIYYFMGYRLESFFHFSLEAKLVIAYAVIFPSILSYYFWHQGIAKIGANKTGQFTHLMPIFGAIEAYFFLGERIEMFHIIGILLIGFGIFLSLFLKTKSSKHKAL